MKNPFRSLAPSRGWWTVLWSDQRAASDLGTQLQEIASIPGCSLSQNSLEIPHTAWMLPQILDFAFDAELALPDERIDTRDYPTFEPVRPLYGYQKNGADFMLHVRSYGVLVADEMGIGKTSQAIVAAERVRRNCAPRPVVIVAPLTVRSTWFSELNALGAISEPQHFCALESRDNEPEIAPDVRFPDVRYYFVHFEIARAWWPFVLRLQSRGLRPCMTIVDEAHLVRNSRTNRAKGANMFASVAPRRVLLTGTPLDNRPSDLWFPLTIACGPRSWGSPNEFRVRYAGARSNGYGLRDGDTPTNVDELRARLEPFYLRRTAEEVGLQLPELTRQVQYCSLGRYEREHHDVLGNVSVEAIVRAIASGVVGDALLPTLARLRQITAAAKMQATLEFVRNAIEQDESVVVFTWERRVALEIGEQLGGYIVTGDSSHAGREQSIHAFQAQLAPCALVATLGALSVGVTLHRARIVVMHDLDWLLRDILQAEKRVHRIGQARACQSVWMLAEQSIDTIMAPVLLRKAELLRDVLDMNVGQVLMQDLGLEQLAGREEVEAQVDRALRVWGAR